MKHYRWSILFLVSIFHLSAKKIEEKPKETWMTIFIHGTVKPQFSLANIAKIVRDNLPHSTLWLGTEIIRNDPFFYQNQAIQMLGLHKVPETHKEGNAARAFAAVFDKLCSLNSANKTNNLYYTYGWSGLLSHKSRYMDAKQFYNTLKQELEQLAKQNIYPKIRIIGYSHGGNIAINLAEVRQKEFPKDTFKIDQILLIGTPIQPRTIENAKDPMFKRIYNFYSQGDWVQKLDAHASRKFDNYKNDLDNITQVKLKVYKRYAPPGKGHLRPTKPNPKTQRRIDPGHMELWFFGWTIYWYREKFPLHPLPMAVFLGWITQAIEQLNTFKDDISFGIYPELNMASLKSEKREHRKSCTYCSFMSPKQYDDLKILAYEYRPDPTYFNKASYKARKKLSHYQAHLYDRAFQRDKKVKRRKGSTRR